MKYDWIVKDYTEFTKDFLDVAFGSKIVAQLLLNRGINSVEKARSYLDPSFYQESKPEEIPDLIKARDRILEAINKKEKITIFGDYDVDGVTSTSCLLITLREFTDNLDFYIPNRLTEGYGLNIEAVKLISKKHRTKLLITCDCGITNHKEIELANDLGMDVIVTDHHSLPDVLPKAHAVLNPKLLPVNHKLHNLPGVGVAYKLAEAILDLRREARSKKQDLLDLVALGMIADLALLVDENRYLVQIGLPVLANTKKVGLKELLRVCGLGSTKQNNGTPTTEHVGFGIAPRINAVGRLADANLAVRLLITDDLLEAVQIANELEVQNRQRQFICEETLNEAVMLVSEQVDLNNDKCIVLAKDSWHHGVIGIVASRIVEKFNLPTILIAIDNNQNIARGSGRSIGKLDIIDVLTKSSKNLEKFGGHKAACGLSVRPQYINDFITEFKNNVNSALESADLSPFLNIDMELSISSLSLDLVGKINKLSPFGLGNPMPLFVSGEVEVIGKRQIGKNGQHLKLILKEKEIGKMFEALIWNHDNQTQFDSSEKIKIAYTPKLNNYNGETFVQLEVKDWELLEQADKREVVELYDFRGKTQECLDLLTMKQVVYFAETEQKSYLLLKTCSRDKIRKAESLVLLEQPPDEIVLLDVIKKSNANKIYFAFPQDFRDLGPQDMLKKLIGMLKYIVNNRNASVNEIDLQSALGLNKTTLAYALEVLVKVGYLSYQKVGGELNINIGNLSRQNFNELIEYNLFVSELKEIFQFKEWICKTELTEIEKVLNQNKMHAKVISQEKARVML